MILIIRRFLVDSGPSDRERQGSRRRRSAAAVRLSSIGWIRPRRLTVVSSEYRMVDGVRGKNRVRCAQGETSCWASQRHAQQLVYLPAAVQARRARMPPAPSLVQCMLACLSLAPRLSCSPPPRPEGRSVGPAPGSPCSAGVPFAQIYPAHFAVVLRRSACV